MRDCTKNVLGVCFRTVGLQTPINELRNHNSLAHPGNVLLNEADAKFAINLVRSIMSYVDDLI